MISRRIRLACCVAAGLATACTGLPLGADPNQAVIDAVARVLPAVVDVEVVAGGPAARVLGKERRGSGVVVTPGGDILTASHVVLGAERLKVVFPSGQQFAAEIAATDSETGLALLHIPPFPGMVVAPLGSAADLKLGQVSIAVSSQGREVRAVTTGVISAFPSFEGYWEYKLDRVIQTDAVINPGSSGGPLLDAQGRVVGILSFSQSDAQRINFAIPVDLITGVMDELIQQVNGVPVESRADFYRTLWRGKVGDAFELIVRRDEQNLSLVVEGGDRQAFFPSPLQGRERSQ